MSYQAIPLNATQSYDGPFSDYDGWLMISVMLLIGFGLVMLASASISIAEYRLGRPLYYFWHQMVALVMGLFGAFIMMKVPLVVWEKTRSIMLLLAIFLLVLVFVPGLSEVINGARRWVKIGSVSFQVSEYAKPLIIIYLAGYLQQHGDQVRSELMGFVKPLFVLGIISALLIMEPDYGTTVVLFITMMGLVFVAGMSLWRFISWSLVGASILAALVTTSDERMSRITGFINPWDDRYGAGFQLTQALIAFGRGEWFGVGLGSSIQKLFYLPEVHTDFMFAVVAEELGFVGTLFVILMFVFIVWRIIYIGGQAEKAGRYFAAYLTYGFALIIGLQALINMGMNMGVLPTKGLTLPFMSYGGNSLIVMCGMIGLILRVDYETRFYDDPEEEKS